ncbi:MAG: C40 family peptidase [Flavobacteriaceae bacterium]
MQYGICHLNIVPLRILPEDTDEMTSQLLYGEHFKVLESRKKWSRIRVSYDGYEGWISNKQFIFITEEEYHQLDNIEKPRLSTDIISHVCANDTVLIPIVLGSSIEGSKKLGHTFEGDCTTGEKLKPNLVNTAVLYINTPYLWGGKTPFGIDSAGFTQMVYKINGYTLKRTAELQSKQGEALSFIEECEPGDLAFFDDNEGVIDHVGIILKDNYIIHANGHVRIDRLDHTGVFNTQEKQYTHKLRVIKKIV